MVSASTRRLPSTTMFEGLGMGVRTQSETETGEGAVERRPRTSQSGSGRREPPEATAFQISYAARLLLIPSTGWRPARTGRISKSGPLVANFTHEANGLFPSKNPFLSRRLPNEPRLEKTHLHEPRQMRKMSL